MSADREFSIKIATSADLAGLTKARTELEEMKRQAIAMGVSTGDLDKQITSLDSQIGSLGRKTLPQAAESVEGLNVHTREMHRVFGELDRIVPGVGEALHSLISPELGPILAAIVAFKLVAEALGVIKANADEAKKALEEMAAANTDAWLKSIDDAIDSQTKYDDLLNDAKTSQEALTTASRDQTAEINAQLEAQNKILEAKERLEIIEADGDKAKETQIREKYGDLKGQAAIDAENANIQTERYNRLDLEGRAPILSARVANARSAQAKQSDITQIFGGDDAVKTRLTAELNEAKTSTPGLFAGKDFFKEKGEKIAGLETTLGAVEARMAEHKAQQDAADKAVDDAIKAQNENTAALSASSEKTRRETAVRDTHQQSFGQVTALNRETSLVGQINKAIELHRQHGEDMNGYVEQLAKILTDSATTTQRKIQLLSSEMDSITRNAGTP